MTEINRTELRENRYVFIEQVVVIGFPDSSAGKEPTGNAETGVQSLGKEDPLEKEMAIHSSILT